MSKRFGRNQKRKMNDKLDKLNEQLITKSKEAQRVSNQLHRYHQSLKEVNRMLGKHFIGLESKDIQTTEADVRQIKIVLKNFDHQHNQTYGPDDVIR